MSIPNIEEAIANARKNSTKRNFKQSFELIINLKDLDLEKPESRIYEIVELPNALSNKKRKICVIASGDLALRATKIDGIDKVFQKSDIEAIIGNKKMARKIAESYDFFLVESSLIGIVAKALGAALGGRGKRPIPISSNQDLEELVSKYSKSVILNTRKNPEIKCIIGTEDMSDKEIKENAEAIIKHLISKLEKEMRNIKSIYIKLTMGKPVKLNLGAR